MIRVVDPTDGEATRCDDVVKIGMWLMHDRRVYQVRSAPLDRIRCVVINDGYCILYGKEEAPFNVQYDQSRLGLTSCFHMEVVISSK
jgi:hypothetical protein